MDFSPRSPAPATQTFGEAVSSSLQYLYFLRFSLIFWALPAVLAALDTWTHASTLTRGILTPPSPADFMAPVFFAVSLGMIALLTARVVVVNGWERFSSRAPEWIEKALGYASDEWAWRTLLVAQLPSAYMLWRYWRNGLQESVLSPLDGAHNFFGVSHTVGVITVPSGFGFYISDTTEFLLSGFAGLCMAAAFWWIVNAIFYILHDEPEAPVQPTSAVQGGVVKHPRRTILLPLSVLPDLSPESEGYPTVFRPLDLLFRFLARYLRCGYYDERTETLYDGHRLLIVISVASFFLYLILCPFTAPDSHPTLITWALRVLCLIFLLLAWGFYNVPTPSLGLKRSASFIFGVIALYFVVLLVRTHLDPTIIPNRLEWAQNFPVVAPVLILLALLCFVFSAIAFFVDRHRIPVLTTFTLYIVMAPNLPLLPHPDHYFQPVPNVKERVDGAPEPARVLANFEQRQCSGADGSCRMIIVTATGGGIHAGSWTATVLTQLELAMQQYAPIAFHDHLLYASTVSGGSVGLEPFLREYYAKTPFQSPMLRSLVVKETPTQVGNGSAKSPPGDQTTVHDSGRDSPLWMGRIRRVAHCSGLEAVAWGLEYGDMARLLLPFVPGVEKLTDRSNALEHAIGRNLTSQRCDFSLGPDEDPETLKNLTLEQMASDLARAGDASKPYLPAFTFNTTAAETGGRFLLSNYATVPYSTEPKPDPTAPYLFGVAPASSYLGTYRGTNLGLTTAARLSATFPYVSSASRIDHEDFGKAFHFVDGGYYDNDGVASAIEFLEEALPSPDESKLSPQILFLEIRDGSDLDASMSDEAYAQQQVSCSKKHSSGKDACALTTSGQLTAPLVAFWNGGHTSVTRRNRRELNYLLDQLERSKRASVTHLVFDYQDDSDKAGTNRHQAAQPLSWYLTPSQMNQISKSMATLKPCVNQVLAWANDPKAKSVPHGERVACNYKSAKDGQGHRNE